MANDAASKLRLLVKPLMRNVMLKIHPDFYANEPVIRQKNQDSVQRLQELMRPLFEDMNSAHSRAELNAAFQAKITSKPIEVGFRESGDSKLNSVAFSFNKTRTPGLPQLQAQRTADLLSLCSSLKIQLNPSTLSDIKAAVHAMGAGSPKPATLEAAMVDSAVARFQAAREREAKANRERRQASASSGVEEELTRHLRRQLHFGKGTRDTGPAQLKLNRENVFFAPNVSPNSYSRVLAHIDSKLPLLDYSSWSNLPVMVVSSLEDTLKGGKPKYPGFVMIPATIHNIKGM
ncbi:hypothetical protein GGH94_005466 [Coemansia aciculifera]|uniref:DUF4460 domain-containing protein n=1 Tax=Coemansia aciculifera TaxID=417176 RepID=A0A9W8M336_9FUNG|nr:hypothetical protein GGH94_005466 [Coemansia aciculifera]KAJ2871191.1 hypothetical protein GGH93_005015 [Coemansia aciculifera]